MKSIASILSIIAIGFGLLGCPSSGGGGGGGSTSAFAVSTTAANFGVVGNTYTSTLAATGGTAPFTWTEIGSVLPANLTLDPVTGVVSGTPITAGNFTATFTVTDNNGMTATGSVLFAIHARTDLVSVDSTGTAQSGASTEPAISNDNGRFVAFTSAAPLAPTPGGSGTQIFLRDRQTNTTTLVSQDTGGNAGNGASSQPTISANGRFVAFTSVAALAPTPGGSGTQIFLRDTQTNTTTLVSQDTGGNAGNGASSQPTISADGRYVAFTSAATTLAPIPGGSGSQIFLRDTIGNATTLVSQDTGGTAGNGASSQPTISSANSRFVAFTSVATLAPTPGGSGAQIFLRDTQTSTTTLVSQDASGNAGNGASSAASISGNGGFVAFSSAADFSLGATGPVDIFVRAIP